MPELDSGLLIAFDIVAFDTECFDRVTVFSLVFLFSRSESRFAFVIFIFYMFVWAYKSASTASLRKADWRLNISLPFILVSKKEPRGVWSGGWG